MSADYKYILSSKDLKQNQINSIARSSFVVKYVLVDEGNWKYAINNIWFYEFLYFAYNGWNHNKYPYLFTHDTFSNREALL